MGIKDVYLKKIALEIDDL